MGYSDNFIYYFLFDDLVDFGVFDEASKFGEVGLYHGDSLRCARLHRFHLIQLGYEIGEASL